MTQSRIVPVTFDVTGRLPTGTTVLEASAGTGKTYAIVGLAARHVAAGVPLSELLLVTFSRFATAELRERTRLRFGGLVAALSDPAAAADSADPLVAMLAQGAPAEVAARRTNLIAALSDFDAATIATTHTFCSRMLDGLGIAGDFENDVTLVEDVGDLITEVTDDLYLRKYSGSDGVPFSVRDAHAFARAAVFQRQARLAPDADPGSDEYARVEFAAQVRAEVERRKRMTNIRDYDDLQTLLRDTLVDPVHGPQACARVRSRFRVVLVDEFQDTDPVQWEIFKSAFHGHTDLVLVGDPKQSIYAFRGAEVFSYLEAVRAADNHQVLPTNWRSDAGLVEALDHVYGNAALGSPEIVVHHVEANTSRSRLPSVTPLRLRYLKRSGHGPLSKAGFPVLDRLRRAVADDVAGDLTELLNARPDLVVDGQARPIAPGDIAVLVRNHKHLSMIQAALDDVGVPSVLAGGTSVYSTQGARDWLWLLQAMEQPSRSARVRLAALTPLLGWTATELDEGGDELTADVSTLVRELVSVYQTSGFAAVYEQLSGRRDIAGRVLSIAGGERRLTDLTHVAQLCNRAVVERGLGLTALVRWLQELISDPTAGNQADQSRRLDSDAEAVQLLTVHRSKGLEFPVVYVPYGWDAARNPTPATLVLHDDSGERVLDVGGKDAPGYRTRREASGSEDDGEELRLLYVALTRAGSAVVLWWAPGGPTRSSPLHRLLFSRDRATPDPRPTVPDDATAALRLAEWGERAGAGVRVEPAHFDGLQVPQWDDRPAPEGELDAARFDRRIDHTWRRTSYSALIAGSPHQAPVASEPEYAEKTDEQTVEPLADPVDDGPGELRYPSLMNSLPFGAAFGTLVHEVLELVDTDVDDLAAEVRSRCADAVRIRLVDIDVDALATALLAVLATPLGEAQVTLAQISSSDRLPELTFELPLGAQTEATLRGIGDLMESFLPATDLLAEYPEHLRRVPAPPLRGFLTGSIDAVLRLPGNSFVVVDYKTNRTARGDLSCLDYTPESMAREMIHSHYPLQALLYSVALHRYLRWRLPDYTPQQHLGGVQYHFVRAMIGPQTPAGCGVFEWKPPAELIVATSDLIAGRVLTP
ncbi:UvrD-helicase domain-containing protein [Gordonia rubripertincta]|uniref:RecBCD enzyme subunit RecB n=1 Tax=Gordonia rubripertincta TaxID=36822 RepID=A0ABT4MYT0_GORRU|nr:UvrD-helicase domain-containing protein [Gordonia rubripertincta]MCZ4550882.1 UvrD-helicase domain-containing protein [Gordonia rubripertincta]